MQVELESDRYKNYKNLEIVLIEEAGNRIRNLNAYEYAYNDFHKYNIATQDDNERLGWILDSIQIKELKNKYKNEKGYYWKSSDIKKYKVTIMKSESFINTIRTGAYTELPEKLILYITRPLIIDKKNAFLSFNSGSSQVGFSTINRFTILMKKVNEKWVTGPGYWDGIVE